MAAARRKRDEGSRPRRRDEQVRVFVERLGSTLTEAGMPRLPARAFAALLSDDDGRMTAAELGDALGVSPASVSAAVRYLAQVHLMHRERQAGTRRDVYVIRDDAWHDAMVSTGQVYAPILAVIASGVGAVGGPATSAGARLALSVEFLQFLTDEMTAIGERWDERRRRAQA